MSSGTSTDVVCVTSILHGANLGQGKLHTSVFDFEGGITSQTTAGVGRFGASTAFSLSVGLGRRRVCWRVVCLSVWGLLVVLIDLVCGFGLVRLVD